MRAGPRALAALRMVWASAAWMAVEMFEERMAVAARALAQLAF
jgi:hypothetical protein